MAPTCLQLRKMTLKLSFMLATLVAHATDSPCKPQNGVQLFQCLREKHIDLQKAGLDRDKAQGEFRQSTSFVNPELGLSGIVGDNFGLKNTEFEADLQFTWELGGKRSARRGHAEAEKAIAEIDFGLAGDRIAMDSAESVMRLRQLSKEIASHREAVDTFARIERQYRSRGRLSPEQEVSLAIFEVATKDTALKLNSLVDEQKSLRDTVSLSLDPESVIDWSSLELADFKPRLPESFRSLEGTENLFVKKIDLESRRAESAFVLEKANSWPDLRIGPVVKLNAEGRDRFYSAGLALSFPLPLLNLNRGARAAALAEVQKTRLDRVRNSRDFIYLKKRLIEKYERLHAHTSKMNDFDAIDRKHLRIEHLFSQGVVSSSLVIESHRQLLEFLEEYHAAEREQLQALWTLYSLEGRLAKEITL
jgi:outer membrane protein, heavy metal efflux system